MTHSVLLCSGTAMAVALMAHAAAADVTPADVWGDWRDYMQGMGYDVTATENAQGDTLTVSDIAMQVPLGEDGGSMSMTMDTLIFTQNDDGSVSVGMPEALPITVDVAPTEPDAKPVKMAMTYSQGGHSLVVSGDPANLTTAYQAATVGLTLDELQVGDETYGAENAKFDLRATDLDSTTTMVIGAMRDYQQSARIGSLTYDVLIDNPDEPTTAKITGTSSNLDFNGTGTVPLGVSGASDIGSLIAAGFRSSGGLTAGRGTMAIDITDPENGNVVANTASDSSQISVDMSTDGISYAGTREAIAVNLTAEALPFPVLMEMATAGFNLTAPVSKSEEPQDFAFGLTLGDFTMSDMLWGVFDPTGQLPRDPATLELDLSGTVKMLIDFLSPEAGEQIATGDAPVEFETLTVNKLLLDAVGAELTGTGDVAFDNSDTTTIPGMPKPVGAVDLQLQGANTLIDKLVAMGILPEQQAMGARMMLGVFAVPGPGDDSLTSKIEFTEDGQVLANGQRIK